MLFNDAFHTFRLDGSVIMEIEKTITLSLPYCMTVYIDRYSIYIELFIVH